MVTLWARESPSFIREDPMCLHLEQQFQGKSPLRTSGFHTKALKVEIWDDELVVSWLVGGVMVVYQTDLQKDNMS